MAIGLYRTLTAVRFMRTVFYFSRKYNMETTVVYLPETSLDYFATWVRQYGRVGSHIPLDYQGEDVIAVLSSEITDSNELAIQYRLFERSSDGLPPSHRLIPGTDPQTLFACEFVERGNGLRVIIKWDNTAEWMQSYRRSLLEQMDVRWPEAYWIAGTALPAGEVGVMAVTVDSEHKLSEATSGQLEGGNEWKKRATPMGIGLKCMLELDAHQLRREVEHFVKYYQIDLPEAGEIYFDEHKVTEKETELGPIIVISANKYRHESGQTGRLNMSPIEVISMHVRPRASAIYVEVGYYGDVMLAQAIQAHLVALPGANAEVLGGDFAGAVVPNKRKGELQASSKTAVRLNHTTGPLQPGDYDADEVGRMAIGAANQSSKTLAGLESSGAIEPMDEPKQQPEPGVGALGPWQKIPDHSWDRRAVEMLWKEYTSPEIGRAIGVSSKTIDNRLTILRKLHPGLVPKREELRQIRVRRKTDEH
jgi:hypothetical protein